MPTASAICEVKTDHSTLKPIESSEESLMSYCLCELVTSLLITGIHMGETSKLGWLIGLVKHSICFDSIYFLYLLLL
jgi:hypothetical protein